MQSTLDGLVIRRLDDNLILRRSCAADADKLAAFNALIHGNDEADGERVGAWVRDLLEKPHPTFGADDFTMVEEVSSGRIVSSLNFIPQTWTYEGIPFGVGRPELVGTLPEYRNRGLVRKQFEEIHRWSAERGDLALAITGIPFYYRIFGYEMCVDLDGARSGFEMNLPKLAENTPEAYRFRPAAREDIPFLRVVYDAAAGRSLLYTPRDAALWELELDGRDEKNVQRLVWEIIERVEDGEAVGFLAHPFYSWDVSCPARMYELKPGASWLEVTPAVARHLWELGQVVCAGEGKTRSAFTFALTGSHPAYEILRDNLPRVRNPYCWYLRVPDLPGFIRHIAPALEARLTASLMPGFSGEVRIGFYSSGLRLAFERGKLTAAEAWQPDAKNGGDVCFPNLTFLQLVFGHRSLDELNHAYADCYWEDDRARVLLSTLFPKKHSFITGVA